MPRVPDTNKKERYNNPFPYRLRKLMHDHNTTQEEIKTVLGLNNRQSVTGYVDGSTNPTVDKIYALSEFYGVSSDYLIGLSNEANPDNSIQAIHKVTGLTSWAIFKLRDIFAGADGPDFLAILSAWIESDQFEPLLVLMRSLLEIEINPAIGNELHRLEIGKDEYLVQTHRFLMPLLQNVISAEIPDIAVTYETIRKERGGNNGEH